MAALYYALVVLIIFTSNCSDPPIASQHPKITCNQNEELINDVCECKSGLYRVKGTCKACDPNSYYDMGAEVCRCNYGYYASQDKCLACHENCGACSGPGFEKCVTCANKSFKLNNGICMNQSCQKGKYGSKLTGKCQLCTQNCNKCQSQSTCDQCSQGFDKFEQNGIIRCLSKEETMNLINQALVNIQMIAKKSIKQKQNISPPTVEENVAPKTEKATQNIQQKQKIHPEDKITSNTNKGITILQVAKKFEITMKNAMRSLGTVYVAYTLSNLPEAILKNQCQNCDKIIKVRLTAGEVIPGIRTWYIPDDKSLNQKIVIQFSFNLFRTPPPFAYELSINPEFQSQFNSEVANISLAQSIDPAILVIRESANLRSSPQELQLFKLNLSEDEKSYLFQ